MEKTFIRLLIVLAVIYGSSCTREACDLDTEVYMNAGFYLSGSGDQYTIDSLTVYGTEIPDSLIVSMGKQSGISLPLNPSSTSCSFIFKNGTRTDTISVYYKAKLEFLSQACGYIFLYELEEADFSGDDIKNIIITSNSVNPSDEENIEIFF